MRKLRYCFLTHGGVPAVAVRWLRLTRSRHNIEIGGRGGANLILIFNIALETSTCNISSILGTGDHDPGNNSSTMADACVA